MIKFWSQLTSPSMKIAVNGARENNLKDVDVEFGEGLTVVTGVSGSGKTSLVFDTLYHEARRRFQEIYTLGSATDRLAPTRVRTIKGLRPAVAVGQDLINRNPNSTMATASGLHPLFRLLYARFGQRTCRQCASQLAPTNVDEIVGYLTAQASLGPLRVKVPLVYQVRGSHRTLLSHLLNSFGPSAVTVDGRPIQAEQDGSIKTPMLDPAKPHNVEVEIGYFDRSITAARAAECVQLASDLGAWGMSIRTGNQVELLGMANLCALCGTPFRELQPSDFNSRCSHCKGQGCLQCNSTGLASAAAEVRYAERYLTELLSLSVEEAQQLFLIQPVPEAATSLVVEINKRLMALQEMGLGYIGLDRSAPTLSRGEGQRLRLAVALVSQLEDMLYILDEPTIGQHQVDVARLLPSLQRLRGQVIFVEHDRQAAAVADTVVDLGPGAGVQGGQVVFTGTPADLWKADTATGRHFSLRERVQLPQSRPEPEAFLRIYGAELRYLDQIDVPLPLKRLTVIAGVSGSGKSTLVDDVLVASLKAGAPVGCRAIDGPPLNPLLVDQKPIGKNPRSNPATYTKLSDVVRDHFAAASSLTASHFSFNRPEGACPACKGMGAIEVRMRYLSSTWITCSTCEGSRYSDEVLSNRVAFGDRQLSIADFYQLSVSEALSLLAQSREIAPASRLRASKMLAALSEVGLGYLTLGQPSPSLSGGEAQRLKLARALGGQGLSSRLLVLDEPTTGLHPEDIAGLLRILDRIVRAGATVVIVEHNPDVIMAADWLIDLGPGAGPQGGRLIYAGPVAGVHQAQDSLTAEALRTQEEVLPTTGPTVSKTPGQPVITIRNAQAHNLKSIDVDIPKNALTVITGVSGSGKSSLVNDVLENEARRRYLESLSMYERQGSRPGPEANADQVSGTGVTISIGTERRLFDRRASVGTATEIAHHLAILLAWAGERTCLECSRLMRPITATASGLQWECPGCRSVATVNARHYSPWHYAAACQRCNGVGTLQEPNPDKLIVKPERPLCAGAMYSPGFFPKGYLCKPFNGGYDMVQALAERYGFDPFGTPWADMSVEAQEAFLFGDPQPMEVRFRTRNQSYSRRQGFPGFYGFIRDWDVGGTYTDTEPCPGCKGARLRPQYLATTFAGHDFHALSEMDLKRLTRTLTHARLEYLANDGVYRPLDLIRASHQTLIGRLRFLDQVGLSYLNLNRLTATLSAGEAQRVRLAGLLGGELSGLTILLDEPSRGLHPSEVHALFSALIELRDQANSIIVIEHDLAIIRAADHLIDIGPGAGTAGGEIVAQGPPLEVAQGDTATGIWLREGRRLATVGQRDQPNDWLLIRGARENNLKGEDIRLPRRSLVGVCGVSGSGKSTLVTDTLGRALAPKKHTTSVAREPIEPGRHDGIEGAPKRTFIVDQVRERVASPASFLGLDRPLREIFSESEQAQELGLTQSDFNRSCSACKGRGTNKIDLGFLPPVRSACDVCHGTGYGPHVVQVRLAERTLPELSGYTLAQLLEFVDGQALFDRPHIRRPLEVAQDVGLGYLVLRQPGHALSGGEAQRLKIARELCRRSKGETLYILDEPSLGQHMSDLQRLVDLLNRMVDDGNSVIVVEHEAQILAACDWLVELGPGGGPEGGRVIFSGRPQQLAEGNTPMASYLKSAMVATGGRDIAR